MSWIDSQSDGVLIRILAQPKASRSEWVGLHGEPGNRRMKVRIAAPPVDGEANEEVLRFVKKSLRPAGVREVRLVRGDASKQKDLLLVGAAPEAIRRLFLESGLDLSE